MSPFATTAMRWQQCAACNERLDELDARVTCPACGGLLDIRYDLAGTGLPRIFADRLEHPPGTVNASGVWRYAELIMQTPASNIVSLPEGNTPLIRSTRVADWAGVDDLQLKHEGMNPTGSFKDRGMTVGVTQARRVGARAVACASTGNTSASLAAYAAIAGIPAIVLVPSGGIAMGKLAQTQAYGARTLAVRGDFDACLRLVRDAAVQLGIYLLNSLNPWRVEGQKAIAFEILQQFGWRAPDVIVLPAGNLGNTAALGKALEESRALGLIERMPRIIAVQAQGASPFADGFKENFVRRIETTADTVASAIRIGSPASWDRGVHAIRASNGAVLAVSDSEILDAQREIGRAGIGCEPASAASVAGVRRAVSSGLIGQKEQVVAILTGHLLKDPEIAARESRNAPIEIEPTMDALANEVRQIP
jgi:threonine synthase